MIPEEMGIIGFANEDFNEYTTPTISSIDQQTVQMGREAFNMLLELVETGASETASVPKIVLEPIPFFRESSLRNGLNNSVSKVNDKIVQNFFTKI